MRPIVNILHVKKVKNVRIMKKVKSFAGKTYGLGVKVYALSFVTANNAKLGGLVNFASHGFNERQW